MKPILISLRILSVAALLLALAAPASYPLRKRETLLVVGWNDEFKSGTGWQPLPVPNRPDVSHVHPGFLRLTLGSRAMTDARPAFYWASLTRVAEVNLERYPILAVRAVHLKGPSWWDVEIQAMDTESGEEQTIGQPAGAHGGAARLVGSEVKTPSLDHDGIILFDLQSQADKGLKISARKFRLRINIAGQNKGGSVEYDWLRFIRREDAERLRANPHVRDLIVEP